MKKWFNHEFESSSETTQEWKDFARDFTKHMKGIVGKDFEVEASRGHFYMSFFFHNKSTDKWVYVSTSDVRHFPEEWNNQLLIRTAKGNRDFTGGSNNFTTLERLGEEIKHFTE